MLTQAQLLEFGFNRSAISHRLAMGRLHRLHRAVFAVGYRQIDQLGRWMAAVLACGAGALLSHESAAALWEIRPPRGGPIEISVPAGVRRRRRGIRTHRREGLRSCDERRRFGIPVTSPVRTLADLGMRLAPAQLEAAVNDADQRDLVDPERLRAALEEIKGQHGVAALQRVLDRRTFVLTDSELERRFLRVVRSSGLPMPETGRELNGFCVDFYWPGLGLVVETDGLRYHRTPGQQTRDRRRDQAHTVAGLTTLRFSHAQVRFEPAYVRATLRAVARHLIEKAPG